MSTFKTRWPQCTGKWLTVRLEGSWLLGGGDGQRKGCDSNQTQAQDDDWVPRTKRFNQGPIQGQAELGLEHVISTSGSTVSRRGTKAGRNAAASSAGTHWALWPCSKLGDAWYPSEIPATKRRNALCLTSWSFCQPWAKLYYDRRKEDVLQTFLPISPQLWPPRDRQPLGSFTPDS